MTRHDAPVPVLPEDRRWGWWLASPIIGCMAAGMFVAAAWLKPGVEVLSARAGLMLPVEVVEFPCMMFGLLTGARLGAVIARQMRRRLVSSGMRLRWRAQFEYALSVSDPWARPLMRTLHRFLLQQD